MDEYALGNAVIPIGGCLEQAGYRGFGEETNAEYYVKPTNSTPFREWLVDGAETATRLSAFPPQGAALSSPSPAH